MKLSIVTPTFNSMRTIQQYMDAVIAQDYPHGEMEIIFYRRRFYGRNA